jgi:3-oxoacyl-[acyl-carrier-protein] synthase II
MNIVVTGAASVILPPGERTIDPSAFLKARKTRKFMGVQDDLALVAAARAIAEAGLAAPLGERAGVYFAVGHIPFEEADVAPVLEASLHEGRFSMAAFSGGGFQRAHPLLTFRCLPNMPVFHVSLNLGVEGPYTVAYPGAGQLYLALEEACAALAEGRVDVALVGGVAHQRNFLVEHHLARTDDPVPVGRLRDAGGVIVLETAEHAAARGGTVKSRLASLAIRYCPFDVLETTPRAAENAGGAPLDLELGPASLPSLIAQGGRVAHALRARDGIEAESLWEVA